MADHVVSVIRDEFLICQICQSQFERPKALPCLHSFCEGCLRDFVHARRYEELGHFPCPCCRRQVDIPENGVEGFPCNHLLISLIDTLESSLTDTNDPLIPLPPNQTSPDLGPPNQRPRSGTRRRPHTSRSATLPLNAPLVPASYNAQNVLMRFGQYGSDLTNFTQPVGLTASDDYIVVSDQRDNRIFVFDWRGQLQSLFTCHGQVQDVALTRKGHLLVANDKSGKALAVKYRLNGQKMVTLGNMFEFEKPSGIAELTADGQVVISSMATNTIFVLGPHGKLIQKFRSHSAKPKHLAVSPKTGHIYISHSESHSIRVFDKFGKSVCMKIGEAGRRPGQLKQPLGLCVDAYDNILVADSGNRRVQVLSNEGVYRDVALDLRGEDNGLTPVNVALGKDNQLVVLVTGPNFAEVQVHRYRCPRRTTVPGSSVCLCQ